MRTRFPVWCVILLMLTTGCIVPADAPNQTRYPETGSLLSVTPVELTVNTPSPTARSTMTMTATSSPFPTPTTSKTPASTQTPEIATVIYQKCLEVLPALPEDKSYRGSIVLLGNLVIEKFIENSYIDKALFFDLKTRQIQLMPYYKITGISISPDGTKYALTTLNDRRIKVFAADGHLFDIMSIGSNPWYLSGWLGNEQIVLVVSEPIEGTNYHVYPEDVVIFNLISHKLRRIPSNYPDIDRARIIWGWEGGGITKYDSTLTRVVYASTIDKDYRGNKGQGYVLWDIVNQKKLVEIASYSFSEPPNWSPDGSKFVINGLNGEFFIVTRDGKVNQITHLNPNPESDSGNKRFYYSGLYSWSPDGQHLALWLETFEKNTESQAATLAVLDVETGEMTDYCISAGYYERTGPFTNLSTPGWSIDGKYVVVMANIQEDGNFDALLIDFEGGFAAKIGENVTPIGWLDTP